MNLDNEIRNRILGKSTGGQQMTEDDLPIIHDLMMVEYGWIPLEEFKKLPMSTLWSLLDCIKVRKEREKKEYDKANKKR